LDQNELAPGDPWLAKVEAAIGECHDFVVFWSHGAAVSDWVCREVDLALARQLGTVTVVHLDGAPLPTNLVDARRIDASGERLNDMVMELARVLCTPDVASSAN
jgi:hypothetical protein